MGRVFLRYVDAETVHCCAACRAHLAAHEAIISKAFQGRHGRAYLFDDVVNVNSGPTENRLLLTGLHVVADIYCNACDTRLGKMLKALIAKIQGGQIHPREGDDHEGRDRRRPGSSRGSRRSASARRAAGRLRRGALLDGGEEGEEGDEDEEDEEEDEGEEEDEEVEEGEDDENAVRHSGDGGLPRCCDS